MFFNENRSQVIFELGGRGRTNGRERTGDGRRTARNDATIALGGRFQQALLQNFIWQVDSFIGGREGRDVIFGARTEILVKF